MTEAPINHGLLTDKEGAGFPGCRILVDGQEKDQPFTVLSFVQPYLDAIPKKARVCFQTKEGKISKIWEDKAQPVKTEPQKTIAKENAEGDQRIAENAAYLKDLTAGKNQDTCTSPEKPTAIADDGIARIVEETHRRNAAQATAPVVQLVPVHPAPLSYSEDEMLLLRNVIAKGCTEPEFKLLMYMATTYGLDPLLKQIWAVKRNENQPALIFAGRDGMLAIAHRSGHFDGMQSGVIYDKDRKPVTAWCEIWRNDMSHSFKTEVPFSEYNTGFSVWKSNPSAMILKVAESVCLRKAFSVSGLYCPEEIDTGDRQ